MARTVPPEVSHRVDENRILEFLTTAVLHARHHLQMNFGPGGKGKLDGENLGDRLKRMSCPKAMIVPIQGSDQDMNQLLHASAPRNPKQDLKGPDQ